MNLARLLAIMLTLVWLGGCGDRFPDYRYKMTIYVDSPDGEKAFSSVRQVRVEEVPSIADSSGRREKVTLEGEAVVLDLPGRTVYALLSKPDNPDYAGYIPSAALEPFIARHDKLTDAQQELRDQHAATHPDPRAYLDEAASDLQKMVKVEGAKDLPRTRPNSDPNGGPRDQWPMFVAFSNPSDPSTVYQLSPEEVGVNRITIEITRDAVTRGVEHGLPWFASYKEEKKRLNGSRSIAIKSNDLADNLGTGSFERER